MDADGIRYGTAERIPHHGGKTGSKSLKDQVGGGKALRGYRS